MAYSEQHHIRAQEMRADAVKAAVTVVGAIYTGTGMGAGTVSTTVVQRDALTLAERFLQFIENGT